MGSTAGILGRGTLDSISLRRGLETMVDSALEQGFLTASAKATSLVATDSGSTLEVVAVSGTRLVWDRLRDAGSARLTATSIARIGRIPTGRPAAPSELEAAQNRLLQTGYVEAVAPPSIRRIPRTAKAEGILHLRELASSYVEAAAGWSRGEIACTPR